jgi:hypothetical protein
MDAYIVFNKHPKNQMKIQSLSHKKGGLMSAGKNGHNKVSVVSVSEEPTPRKIIIYSYFVEKFQFFVGCMLILCLTSIQKIR